MSTLFNANQIRRETQRHTGASSQCKRVVHEKKRVLFEEENAMMHRSPATDVQWKVICMKSAGVPLRPSCERAPRVRLNERRVTTSGMPAIRARTELQRAEEAKQEIIGETGSCYCVTRASAHHMTPCTNDWYGTHYSGLQHFYGPIKARTHRSL